MRAAPISQWRRPACGASRPAGLGRVAALAGLLALLLPASALGAFTRPFVRSIPGPTSGFHAGPFAGPSGVAVDGEGHLWVSDPALNAHEDWVVPFPLDEFEGPAGSGDSSFVKTLEIEGEKGKEVLPPGSKEFEGPTVPISVAIDDLTGSFYIASDKTVHNYPGTVEAFAASGSFERRCESFESRSVAVDNSGGASADSVYVAVAGAIVKLTSTCAASSFSEAGKVSYLSGNRITGTPTGLFRSVAPTPTFVSVDSEGDIFVVARVETNGKEESPAVYEYRPSGLFVGEFTGAGAPPVSATEISTGFQGYAQYVAGIAVDPVSHHLLVAVNDSESKHEGEHGVVDEFDSSGKYLNQFATIEAAPGVNTRLGRLGQLTTDAAGHVYAVDESAHAVDVFGPGHFRPTLTLAEPSSRTASQGVVSGTFDPEGQPPSECRFEYVSEAAYHASGFSDLSTGGTAACSPGAGSIPADSAAHAVQGELTGLVSGTTYYYRLEAGTSGVLGGVSHTEPLALTAPGAPQIDSTSVDNISSRFVDFHANIAPRGADTAYYFEYGPTTAYGNDAPLLTSSAPRGADIGEGGPSGSADVAVVQQIGGLAPGTLYHFRVVAINEVEGVVKTIDGPDETFATLPKSPEGLPDRRAYEMLTPPNKGSAEDMFGAAEAVHNDFENFDRGYSSESGQEFLLETTAAFGSFAASSQNAYVFRRGASGWSTLPLASPALGVQAVRTGVFDPASFAHIGVLDTVGAAPGVESQRNMALVGPPGGPYATVHSEADVVKGNAIVELLVGGSRDLSRLVLQSADPALLPAQQDAGSHALFEWTGGGLSLLSVDEEGEPFRCGAWLGQSQDVGATSHAVSADGGRVFFTAPDPYLLNDVENKHPGCWNHASSDTPQLYTRAAGQTVRVSAPEEGVVDPTGRHPAVYVGASNDGSRVFFITESELTRDALTQKVHDPELYEYETASGVLTRISVGEPGTVASEQGKGAGVQRVPAVSADGSAVYFTAMGALTHVAPATTGKEEDLYRYDTNSRVTTYIATVDRRDYPSNAEGKWWGEALPEGVALATSASWDVSSDGRYLVFATTRAISSFDNHEANHEAGYEDCPVFENQDKATIGRCSEVYRYDAALPVSEGSPSVADNPVCVSCDPSGAKPVSDAFFGHSAGPQLPAGPSVRAVSENGECVWFDSADPLVPQDTNGTLDAYEWEAPGAAGCAPSSGVGACAQASGCLRLISSGVDAAPSFFLSASSDGSDVFIGTHARLVPQDTDNAGDLYDARIGGGFASNAGVGPCEGDACSTPPSVPIDQTPGSLTFTGAGDTNGQAGPPSEPKQAMESRARRLAKALSVCRRRHVKHKRALCEAQAHKRYGVKAKRSARRMRRATGRSGK
jgi:hypothetical protein